MLCSSRGSLRECKRWRPQECTAIAIAADCSGWEACTSSGVKLAFAFVVFSMFMKLNSLLAASDTARLWRDYRLYKVSEVGNVTCVSSCQDGVPLSTVRITSDSKLRLERSSCPIDTVVTDAKKMRLA